jgi:hypothetical protein
MNFQERFGCFFLALGLVGFLLFAAPIVKAFRTDPESVPLEWLGATAAAILILWIGWKLYTAGRRSAESKKPPSLGARLAERWRSGGMGEDGKDAGRRE